MLFFVVVVFNIKGRELDHVKNSVFLYKPHIQVNCSMVTYISYIKQESVGGKKIHVNILFMLLQEPLIYITVHLHQTLQLKKKKSELLFIGLWKRKNVKLLSCCAYFNF